jgi:copper(I)-binding protein
MTALIQRRRLLRAGAATAFVLASPWALGHEYYTRNLRISHPWTRATAGDATSAVVCMTIDEVIKADRLIGIESPVAAGAEMVGAAAAAPLDIALPLGKEIILSELGSVVRLVGLRHPLELGRSYPLTLVFADGGEVEATLDVAYAAQRQRVAP